VPDRLEVWDRPESVTFLLKRTGKEAEPTPAAAAVNNLGSVLQDLGDLAGATAHYERALAIFRQFLEEDHPNTKLVRNNLAALGLPID
jgi:tetratricopeptide (TPR) repeat protein